MPAFKHQLLKPFLATFLLGATTAHGQTGPYQRQNDRNTNAWLMFFSDARVSDHLSVHTEFQLRRAEVFNKPMQEFARVGLNYHLDDQVMLTAGYAYAAAHPYGDFPAAEVFPEHRGYQQVLLKSNYGPVLVTHRYRQEQRWIRRPLESSFTYTNRTRYQLRAVLPLSGGRMESLQPRTLYLAVYDEPFVNFGKNVGRNVFDQNRAYAGLGYQFTKATSVDIGYMHQIVAQGNGVVFEQNHTLMFGLNFNPDFRRRNDTPPAPLPGQ